jgi:hypothetical protein
MLHVRAKLGSKCGLDFTCVTPNAACVELSCACYQNKAKQKSTNGSLGVQSRNKFSLWNART